MGIIQTQIIDQTLVATPPTGWYNIFIDTDGVEKKKDDVGVVTLTSGSGQNDKVKASATDTTEGFLDTKITGTADKITISKINSGANESFVVTVGVDVFDKVSDDSDNIAEGAINLFLTSAERAKIGNSATQTALDLKRDKTAIKNSIEDDSDSLQLVNDANNPGNNQYYGTNASGTKGYHTLPTASSSYFKSEVLSTTNSNNFNSNTPTNVPDLSFTITQDGDYVFYSVVNCNNDQNEELDMYFAKNGTTETDSLTIDRQQKNSDQSVQSTCPIDGLVIGDVITVQFNTRGDNVDLLTRRMLIQSWS